MRGGFLTDYVDLRIFSDGQTALLLTELVFYDGNGRRHAVHPGFLTDGGSIPRLFWRVVGPPVRSPYIRAYVLHDHYCAKAVSIEPGAQRDALRLSADQQLRDETLPVCGANAVVCAYHYRAVRTGARATRNRKPVPYPGPTC